jgi:RNA polymerase sigma-70 factor (ECF subfamily)
LDKHQHISDTGLLEKYYRDHDNSWLGILFQRYTLLLFGVCMKYLKNEEEAKDAVQQVFMKALTELGKYKVEYFKSWIYMVAKNHCLMKLRELPGKQTAALSEQLSAVLPEEEADLKLNLLEKEHTLELLSVTLQELSPEQKHCVTLFYLEKRSYQEIADQTGFSLMQVKSYIQNGKRNLKILLDKKLNNN